jgi:hypothetical protein
LFKYIEGTRLFQLPEEAEPVFEAETVEGKEDEAEEAEED